MKVKQLEIDEDKQPKITGVFEDHDQVATVKKVVAIINLRRKKDEYSSKLSASKYVAVAAHEKAVKFLKKEK